MICLYNHGGSENHGCEALVRSTIEILDQPVRLFSQQLEQDVKYSVNKICDIISDTGLEVKRGSLAWFLSSLQIKATGKIDLLMKYQHRNLMHRVSHNDVCLSIGGDNYCYTGTDKLAAINRNIRKKGVKTVLWGCSVEPTLLQDKCIVDDLSQFDLITARESITYEALKKVNPNTMLIPDPAFTLERVDLPLPEGWVEGKMIGINASPLILDSANDGEMALNAYKELIKYIIEKTPFHVALIPHVVWNYNDDRKPLGVLYNEFKHSGKVIMVEDHNCMELKGYIARCRMFIGARTHSTIAAYSSCVPTLVLGYSVKSRGIAQDLFGTEKNYVISVQGLKDKYELVNGLIWLMENEDDIRNHLESIMDNYIEKAKLGYFEIEKLK